MPYASADDDAGWQQVQQRVAESLEQFAGELGPRECAHGDWVDCEDDCKFADTRPKPNSMTMVRSWVLVATVEDTLSNDPIISSVAAPGQRNHETKGLLHVALYE